MNPRNNRSASACGCADTTSTATFASGTFNPNPPPPPGPAAERIRGATTSSATVSAPFSRFSSGSSPNSNR